MLIAIGMLLHLFLDAMWQDQETLWWPFLGFGFTPSGAASAGEYVVGVLTDPAGVGHGGDRSRLPRACSSVGRGSATRWPGAGLVATGTVDVPIDRSG